MDFEEGLNGYSSFLVSVHWQIAGIIFQTGSIETLTAAITKLLFHLPSKKACDGLHETLLSLPERRSAVLAQKQDAAH